MTSCRDNGTPQQMLQYWRARPLASASRALEVAATLAPVAARIAADRAFVAADEPAAERAARQRLRATQARDALVELGPAFIKLGQQLSIVPTLDVAAAGARSFRRGLCDAVPAVPTSMCARDRAGGPRRRRDRGPRRRCQFLSPPLH